jgi:CheY-like chemotaxis protein
MRSILVVDDEVFVTRVAKLALERAGYHVEVAADGEEALRSLGERRFDAVVTDLMMPRMNGRELCLAIHEHLAEQELLIFVATSSSEEEHRDWARELPRTEFLEKPLSLRWLIARLEEHFEKTPDGADAQR